tara:strand:- start:333 stop:1646 length:1314 start_codon:yes stop_codon:yes gene_type:complete
MGGGTLQLVITGGADIHIIGNPETSFFKSVYRRHTNFSIECIEQIRMGTITNRDFKLTYNIVHSGDLLNKMHFEIDLPEQEMNSNQPEGYCSYSNNTAYCFIKDVSIYIGDKLIDKHDGRYFDIMNELNHKDGSGIDYLINRHSGGVEHIPSPSATKLYVPLHFWFCKDESQSLPIIALQYHDVRIVVNFRGINKIIQSEGASVSGTSINDPNKPNIKLWGNFFHLDVDERKRFVKNHHEYLIEQVQTIQTDYRNYINLSLNHPVKCIYWVIQNNEVLKEKTDYKNIDYLKNVYGNVDSTEINNRWYNGNDYLNYKTHEIVNPSTLYGDIVYEHFDKMTLLFNGIERFKRRDGTYFRTLQPIENHYTIPNKNIYMYSFCLNPEQHQPSGVCNFSRIDNFSINFTGDQLYDNYTFILYAKNYNILRIMEGMAGVLYAN